MLRETPWSTHQSSPPPYLLVHESRRDRGDVLICTASTLVTMAAPSPNTIRLLRRCRCIRGSSSAFQSVAVCQQDRQTCGPCRRAGKVLGLRYDVQDHASLDWNMYYLGHCRNPSDYVSCTSLIGYLFHAVIYLVLVRFRNAKKYLRMNYL